jgi:hypothetical protein
VGDPASVVNKSFGHTFIDVRNRCQCERDSAREQYQYFVCFWYSKLKNGDAEDKSKN